MVSCSPLFGIMTCYSILNTKSHSECIDVASDHLSSIGGVVSCLPSEYYFVFSPGIFSLFRIFAWRPFVISSFRLAFFCYFVFSRGVFSFFRLFAWRFFVFSSFRLALWLGHAKRRNNEKKTPREITKRRNNAWRKDEITKRHQAKKAKNKSLKWRCFAWRFFFFSRSFSSFCVEHFVISSFRLALFRLFVVSLGVFSLFRLFAWHYFVLAPRHNARRKDEKPK